MVADEGDLPPVGGDGNAADDLERRGNVDEFAARGDVVDLQLPRIAPGDKRPAIGCERHGGYRGEMPGELGQRLAVGRPQPDGAVAAGGGDELAARVIGDVVDRARMSGARQICRRDSRS